MRLSVEDEHERHLRMGIWLLHLPNKVKNFMWRACQNSLPTKQNLVRRIVITDPHCDRCCVAAKNIIHALWLCPMLDSMWVATDFWTCRSSTQFLDFRELLGWILQMQNQPELFAFTVQGIWTQRNRTRVQQPGCSFQQLAQESKCRLAEVLSYCGVFLKIYVNFLVFLITYITLMLGEKIITLFIVSPSMLYISQIFCMDGGCFTTNFCCHPSSFNWIFLNKSHGLVSPKKKKKKTIK